ncbi:MAG: hypothetical protein ACYTF7_05690 [Planctomycetota bacterium]|jgi:hypothetical protein
MRRVFRKVFRVLRHPLTALVAFLYVGWAVWQAPAATLVGDLAPGVRSFTRYQNFETAFVGYMYPVDGGYELITRRDCDGRLPEYSAADYSAMEMWYFVVGFQARWWGIFDQSICVTGAGAHYTVEPFGTDRSANRQLWNRPDRRIVARNGTA